MEALYQYLSAHFVPTREERETLARYFRPQHIARRELFHRAGSAHPKLAFICKGCMRLYKNDAEGQLYIAQFATENWWITDRESFYCNRPSEHNIDAIEETEALVISGEDFKKMSAELPRFEAMMEQVQQRNLLAMQRRMESALSHSAERRYQEFVEQYPGHVLRIPQHMIAAYLGITKETLSRVRRQAAVTNAGK